MGFTATTVGLRDALQNAPIDRREELCRRARDEGRRRHDANVIAWFLDALTERLEPSLPKRIFSQGCGDPPGPGDLPSTECLRLAEVLGHAQAEDVLACYRPIEGSDPAGGLEAAREFADLARQAAADGGLAVS
jgi:hypothetical protein